MSKMEIRKHEVQELRIEHQDDTVTLHGYVTKYNERSQFMGFYEQVDKRAFDNTLKNDNNVFALYNHDWNKILGSTRNGTLKLETDDIGLKFTLQPKANTSFLNDARELVDSGELRGMSFGFIVKEDDWESRDGHDIRTLKDVDLREVTLTAIPAYESSEVALRSYQDYIGKNEEQRKQQTARIKTLLNIGGM